MDLIRPSCSTFQDFSTLFLLTLRHCTWHIETSIFHLTYKDFAIPKTKLEKPLGIRMSCRSYIQPSRLTLILIFCCLRDIREPAKPFSDQASHISHTPLCFFREMSPQIKNTLPQMKDLRWQRYMQQGISLQNRDGDQRGEKRRSRNQGAVCQH